MDGLTWCDILILLLFGCVMFLLYDNTKIRMEITRLTCWMADERFVINRISERTGTDLHLNEDIDKQA